MTEDDELPKLANPFGMPEFKEGEDPFTKALTAVIATPEGKQFVWGILEQAKVYNEAFSGNSTDIYEKGKRSIGLWLIASMTEADPTAYPRMLLAVAQQEQIETQRAVDEGTSK